MNGIGAYFSPSPVQPINPAEVGTQPVQPISGMGSYYSPSPFQPVPVQGLGTLPIEGKTVAFIVIAAFTIWLVLKRK